MNVKLLNLRYRVLAVLAVTEGSGILNLVFHDNYLLTGCETSCFGFKINDDNLKQKNRFVFFLAQGCRILHVLSQSVAFILFFCREPDFELVLPKGNVAQVDGLVKVGKDLVGTKHFAPNRTLFLAFT